MRWISVVTLVSLSVLTACGEEVGVTLDIAAPPSTTSTTTAVEPEPVPEDLTAPAVTVPFWNGHTAAVTWTFDDGSASHLDRVVPFLDERGIPATFYPTCNTILLEAEGWRSQLARHEVANHTMSHAVAGPDTDVDEIVGCDVVIREVLGVEPFTFAYTNGYVDEPYLRHTKANHVAARGTWTQVPYVLPDDELDFHALPGVALGEVDDATPTAERLARPLGATADALELGGWVTYVVHAIDEPGYARITFDEFVAVVEASADADVWYATFADATTHLRVARAFAETTPEWVEENWRWTWPVVPGMSDIAIRVEPAGGTIHQAGTPVPVDGTGHALIDARLGALDWLAG